jgi:hypothetical protein
MKRCPTCQQTYPDDAPDFCPHDGMRLVRVESAEYDSESTVVSSGLRGSEPASEGQPPATMPQQQTSDAPSVSPPTLQPSQQWQPQVGGQIGQQGWSPSTLPSSPSSASAWGNSFQQQSASASHGAPFVPAQPGSGRALAIAALVLGTNAINIMAMFVIKTDGFPDKAMLVLSILAIALGSTALILSLRKPSPFGGIPLAIAGLSMGTAALVYYFMR